MDGRDELLAQLAALRAENQQLRAEAAEAESANEKFRVLFERSSDAHLIFDDTGILDCNRAAVKMLRCADKAQLLRLHPAVLSPELQPDGRASLAKSVEMDQVARDRGYHRFEWVHRRMDGEDFPVEVTLTPVQLSTGPAMLVVWHELTEQRRQLALIRAQASEIQRLSMPVIELWAGVLLIPVLGDLDHTAARALTDATLEAVARARARAVVVDLTGLTGADAPTARHLVDLLAALRLLGADGTVVGIQPAVARAFVAAGADLSRVRTLASLREALERDAGRSSSPP